MIPDTTLKHLTDTLELILDKFEKETGGKMMLTFSIKDENIKSGIIVTKNLDYRTACEMSNGIASSVYELFIDDRIIE